MAWRQEHRGWRICALKQPANEYGKKEKNTAGVMPESVLLRDMIFSYGRDEMFCRCHYLIGFAPAFSCSCSTLRLNQPFFFASAGGVSVPRSARTPVR